MFPVYLKPGWSFKTPISWLKIPFRKLCVIYSTGDGFHAQSDKNYSSETIALEPTKYTGV